MTRISGLVLQFTILATAAGTVAWLQNGAWGSDAILLWTVVIALGLASITVGQIVIVSKRKAELKQALRRQRTTKAPVRVIRHTERLKRSIKDEMEADRQRVREEAYRNKLEAQVERKVAEWRCKRVADEAASKHRSMNVKRMD